MAKRIQIERHGGPEVLQYVDFTPPALKAREVRVRNRAIGLNFIDTYFRSGLYPLPGLPSGLGNEGAGVVEAVGEGVTCFREGDRVAYCGSPLGAYSEVHVMPQECLVQLPSFVEFEQAAAVMLKGLTAQYLLRQTYPLQGGETILFHAAAGGVGSIACQWARALGVRLIGTAGNAGKAERAKTLGAWQVVNTSCEDTVQRVLELTDGRKCPVVYDSVGRSTWEISLQCTAHRGLLVSFGNASGPVTGVDLGILAQKGSLYVTRPMLSAYADTPEHLQAMADELFAMLSTGKIQADISQRYPLAEAAQAQQALAGRQTVGSTVLLP